MKRIESFNLIGQAEPVLKAGTATAFHGEAKDRGLPLARCNGRDTGRGGWCQGKLIIGFHS